MPWYKSGTVSVAQNSNAVIGAGTAFIANGRVGDAFRGPDGGWYEITNIASDTAMAISPNYQGAPNSAGVYALAPMQGYVKDSADALRALVNTYGEKLAALGTTGNYDILPITKGGTGGDSQSTARTGLGLGTAATATITTSQTDTTIGRAAKIGDFGLGSTSADSVVVWPNASLNNVANVGQGNYSTAGAVTDIPAGFSPSTISYGVRTGDGSTTGEYTQTLRSLAGATATRGGTGTPSAPTWSAWSISAKAGANSDITSLSGLTTPMSVAQGGTGKTSEFRKGQISGLQMVYAGRTSLTIGSGSAYIPSLGKIVELSADKALTSMALAATAWHHVYLYENAGVADIEVSGAAPVRYFGTAYHKNGDTSRRYLGSFLTNGSAQMWAFRHVLLSNELVYLEGSPPTAPFLITNAWAGTSPSPQPTSTICPKETATHAHLGVQSTGLAYFYSYEQASVGDQAHFVTVCGSTATSFNILSDIWVPLDRRGGVTAGYYLVSAQNIAGSLVTSFVYGYKFER
ncbi:hypothetical protein ACW9HW_01925 [Pseudomonas sp. SDO5532_S415]